MLKNRLGECTGLLSEGEWVHQTNLVMSTGTKWGIFLAVIVLGVPTTAFYLATIDTVPNLSVINNDPTDEVVVLEALAAYELRTYEDFSYGKFFKDGLCVVSGGRERSTYIKYTDNSEKEYFILTSPAVPECEIPLDSLHEQILLKAIKVMEESI